MTAWQDINRNENVGKTDTVQCMYMPSHCLKLQCHHSLFCSLGSLYSIRASSQYPIDLCPMSVSDTLFTTTPRA